MLRGEGGRLKIGKTNDEPNRTHKGKEWRIHSHDEQENEVAHNFEYDAELEARVRFKKLGVKCW